MTRLHHVQLAAPRGAEDECRAFWVAGLGFTEIPKPPALAARGGIWVCHDQLEIHIGVEENFSPARKAHPGIVVGGHGAADSLDTWAARLAVAGVPVTWDDGFPGMRRIYSEDNCGNRLEFLEPVAQ